MPAYLLDDHLLYDTLRGAGVGDLRGGRGGLWTTGIWHHRLCRAMGTRQTAGAFSRRFEQVDQDTDESLRAALIDLPLSVGSLAMRHLAWPMARLLDAGVRLNLLGLEAIAAAEELDAMICLAAANESPPLVAAAAARGIEVRIVQP